MLHVILYQPQIPQNTGNAGRLCAFAGARLHLVHPLGFEITDRHLKRSGMDYWDKLEVRHHDSWQAFLGAPGRPQRVWLFSTKSGNCFWSARFADGDGLLFGNEGAGAPDWLHEWAGEDRRVAIPRFGGEPLRSLNLSTAAGIALYEALRQIRAS